jgi:glycosyltransferase involved in cell wall biosynthesis
MYEGGSIHGPAHAVADILSNTHDVSVIQHPLSGFFESSITSKGKEKILLPRSTVGVGRWIKEMIAYAGYILRTKPQIIVSIDPINTFPVLLLQAFGVISTFIYYTVDFADKRSNSPWQDWIYHVLDSLAAQSATQCWAVSERILAYRKNHQCISSNKLFLVPNSPAYVPKRKKMVRDPHALVIVSNIHKGVGYEEIFSAFFELTKTDDKISLTIIGDGKERVFFEQQVRKRKLQNKVAFLGQLSHEKVHDVLSKSGIGLALYTGFDSHRFYSDSMKARDYLSEGLPVIISGDLGTADEIERSKAGVWIELTPKNIVKAVQLILVNPSIYANYQKNALNLAKERDFSLLISTPIRKLSI